MTSDNSRQKFRAKVYPFEGETRRCNLTEPTFWIHPSGEPDNNSDINCVTMLFNNANYPDGGINTWHGDRCDMNYNGEQGIY